MSKQIVALLVGIAISSTPDGFHRWLYCWKTNRSKPLDRMVKEIGEQWEKSHPPGWQEKEEARVKEMTENSARFRAELEQRMGSN